MPLSQSHEDSPARTVSTAGKPSRSSLAVIIPMYNEANHAERCVRSVCAVLSEHLPESELFVVNDGSSDGTAAILDSLGVEQLPLVVSTHPVNQGYGAALLTGARAAAKAGFEFGLFMDSDLTNDPTLIPRFAEIVATNNYDLVKASRYVPGGGMKGVPFYHRAVTVLGNVVASKLIGMAIRDVTNGFRAVRLSMLQEVSFAERGFPLILEELYLLKRQGARATEFPYTLTARSNDQGSSKFSYSPDLFYRYLKYAVKAALVR